jgi:hypothetical protein
MRAARWMKYAFGLLLGCALAAGVRAAWTRSDPVLAAPDASFILPEELPIHDLLVSLAESLQRGTADATSVIDASVLILGCLKPEQKGPNREGNLEIPIISENVRYGRLVLLPRREDGYREAMIEVAIESSEEYRAYSKETDLTLSYSEGPDSMLGFIAVAETHVHRRDTTRALLHGQGPIPVGGAFSISAQSARWFPILLEIEDGPDGQASWTTRSGTEEPRELVALADAGIDYVAAILRAL